MDSPCQLPRDLKQIFSDALAAVCLKRGRFHQIRAQFAFCQMPLLGDGKYGSRENAFLMREGEKKIWAEEK